MSIAITQDGFRPIREEWISHAQCDKHYIGSEDDLVKCKKCFQTINVNSLTCRCDSVQGVSERFLPCNYDSGPCPLREFVLAQKPAESTFPDAAKEDERLKKTERVMADLDKKPETIKVGDIEGYVLHEQKVEYQSAQDKSPHPVQEDKENPFENPQAVKASAEKAAEERRKKNEKYAKDAMIERIKNQMQHNLEDRTLEVILHPDLSHDDLCIIADMLVSKGYRVAAYNEHGHLIDLPESCKEKTIGFWHAAQILTGAPSVNYKGILVIVIPDKNDKPVLEEVYEAPTTRAATEILAKKVIFEWSIWYIFLALLLSEVFIWSVHGLSLTIISVLTHLLWLGFFVGIRALLVFRIGLFLWKLVPWKISSAVTAEKGEKK